MTGRKNAWTVSTSRCPPYKALENFSKALYGTTGGTYSACIIRPVMNKTESDKLLVTLCDVFDRKDYNTF